MFAESSGNGQRGFGGTIAALQSHPKVGEERLGPGCCMVTKAHTAVPRCQGLLLAAAAMEHPSGGEGRRKPLLFSASSLL